ncbi:membrane-binding protein [Capnocytophaga sp.]|uniref:membrane-binding protein n=1 Tax=Capnocytophaga sp. TaxID=44737 RepID=UPI0026DD8B7C|nr:membrane-binding protein [Capnocytophaga sp.]MDO5104646.1 membrane-binding protein [Capnocytophaga sp.]
MAALTYSKQITSVKLMVDGLRNHAGEVTKIDNEFINKLEALRTEVETLNSEQEKLKADLKAKTKALDDKMKELIESHSFARTRVKVDIPQENWKEFGISASR